ncbi:probably inactive leucine-rich repeat receptor-like protein kinase At5g48380 [Pistacia vera]|uniref:probably inactive leucine-rich repeat receptor-like protein kinase At5g48380 n=1 Tax=Pistacia vera TaxID=55513 RepID=UPI001262D117|nr:probably inactive leucine-rich repeat receptor-like protein kinase At5g48380 [Pistacia vera]
MAFILRAFILLFFYTFVWNLSCITPLFSSSTDEYSDVQCLKSIKDSLEDPFNHLTWTFEHLTAGSFCNFVGVECWHDQEFKILNLSLSNMALKGKFPQGLEHCKSLQFLDLSGNHLYGTIPLEISQNLPNLISLNLANNSFSGEIPSTLANCIYLNMLELDHNQLTGQIPQQLGQLGRIRVFNVSNNMLSGPVPNFPVPEESYANNTELCGEPLKPCEGKGGSFKFDFSFESGFVAGFVFSAVSFIISFVSCVCFGHI